MKIRYITTTNKDGATQLVPDQVRYYEDCETDEERI